MRKIFFITFIFFTSFVYSYGSFEQFLSTEKSEFEGFKNEVDKEFYDYLKTSWEEFKAFSAMKRDEKPKIKTPPVVWKEQKKMSVEKPMNIVNNTATFNNIAKTDNTYDKETKIKKSEQENSNFVDNKKDENLFFDIDLKRYSNISLIENPINGKKIAEVWKILATKDYDALVKDILVNGRRVNLDDWGYFKVVKQTTEKIYPEDYNSKILLAWYILSKLGYDVKLGYNDDYVYLLLPAKQQIYGAQFFVFENVRYYIIWHNGKIINKLYSYSGSHPDARNTFTFKIEPLRVQRPLITKELEFDYSGRKYSFNVYYDAFNVDFYKDFPQTDLSVYKNADVSTKIAESVVEGLKNILSGRSETEAVNIILRFVQKAFAYKTDQEQFGYEKYLLPDETVYYPYSDCEDRSIIFSYLVKKILGLEVVLLEYPGHIATGVKFNEDVKGDKVLYGGKVYVVCDPTYINADIGMAMPQFKKVNPKIIF
jgi:hypothetical protein